MTLGSAPPPPLPDVYLSDLKPLKATCGWGSSPRMDRSIQDKPLTVNGRTFAKGIGTHALSEIVFALSQEQCVHTTGVALRDWCFETPRNPVDAEREQSAPFGELARYDYPGAFRDTDGGHRVAALRMEEQTAGRQIVGGASNCRGFAPGHGFELREHPRRDWNQDLMLLRVTHETSQEGVKHPLRDVWMDV